MARVTKLTSTQIRNPARPHVVQGEGTSRWDKALREMQDDQHLHSLKFKNQQMRAIREGAHPKILEFEEALVKRMSKHMVPLWAHSIVRGKNQQEAAFAGGFSKARFGKSPHNFGCAVDLVHGTKAWGLSDDAWKIIGEIGKEVAKSRSIHIVWGGDFKSLWDPAHWELRDWKTEKVNFPWLTPSPTVQTQFREALNRPLPTDL